MVIKTIEITRLIMKDIGVTETDVKYKNHNFQYFKITHTYFNYTMIC